MKRHGYIRVCAAVAALAILTVAGVAEADYLIILRNGKEITVRQYEEEGDQIVYKRYGGKISISKTSVEAIKDLNTGEKRAFDDSGASQEPKAAPQVTRPPAQASPAQPFHPPSKAQEPGPIPTTRGVPEKKHMTLQELAERLRRAEPTVKEFEAAVREKYTAREKYWKSYLSHAPEHSMWERYLLGGMEAYDQKRHAEAERQYLAAIQEAEGYGEHDPRVAISLDKLADLYIAQGKYDQAEPLLKRGVAIMETAVVNDALDAGMDRAAMLKRYASLLRKTTRETPAAEIEARANLLRRWRVSLLFWQLEEALKEAEQLGKQDPLVAITLNRLSQAHALGGQFAEAERLMRQALAIMEARVGPDHPSVATILNDMAILYNMQGTRKYVQAEPFLQRALAIREKALGPNHPDLAKSLNDLSAVYAYKAQYAKAEPLLQRALAIMEKVKGPDHHEVADILDNMAVMYRDDGKTHEAAQAEERVSGIRFRCCAPPIVTRANSRTCKQRDLIGAWRSTRLGTWRRTRRKVMAKIDAEFRQYEYYLFYRNGKFINIGSSYPLKEKELKLTTMMGPPDRFTVQNGLLTVYRREFGTEESMCFSVATEVKNPQDQVLGKRGDVVFIYLDQYGRPEMYRFFTRRTDWTRRRR